LEAIRLAACPRATIRWTARAQLQCTEGAPFRIAKSSVSSERVVRGLNTGQIPNTRYQIAKTGRVGARSGAKPLDMLSQQMDSNASSTRRVLHHRLQVVAAAPSQCGSCRGCMFASNKECVTSVRDIAVDKDYCELWAGNVWCGGSGSASLASVPAMRAMDVSPTGHAEVDTASDGPRPGLMRTRAMAQNMKALGVLAEGRKLMRTRHSQDEGLRHATQQRPARNGFRYT